MLPKQKQHSFLPLMLNIDGCLDRESLQDAVASAHSIRGRSDMHLTKLEGPFTAETTILQGTDRRAWLQSSPEPTLS